MLHIYFVSEVLCSHSFLMTEVLCSHSFLISEVLCSNSFFMSEVLCSNCSLRSEMLCSKRPTAHTARGQCLNNQCDNTADGIKPFCSKVGATKIRNILKNESPAGNCDQQQNTRKRKHREPPSIALPYPAFRARLLPRLQVKRKVLDITDALCSMSNRKQFSRRRRSAAKCCE
jgi:hypothetical protein